MGGPYWVASWGIANEKKRLKDPPPKREKDTPNEGGWTGQDKWSYTEEQWCITDVQ